MAAGGTGVSAVMSMRSTDPLRGTYAWIIGVVRRQQKEDVGDGITH
jgi:hypothetical protein